MKISTTILTLLVISFIELKAQHSVFIEVENFDIKGGWVVDQQFVHLMGSSYLMAHGMGSPVANASTVSNLPSEGNYKLWVRTKDWVSEHDDSPGRFKIILNTIELDTEFGTNQGWNWVDGGIHSLTGSTITTELKDLTGFNGRCDAIYLTQDLTFIPPNEDAELEEWRREQQNLPPTPVSGGHFDVVIIGGGIAGCGAAVAAARENISVAIIQDRPVFGGNASKEVRVSTIGLEGFKIVDEINFRSGGNGSDMAIYDDEIRQQVMDNESNITQFLSNRAFSVKKNGNSIESIDIKHIETGEEQRISGDVFIDCTGDGWIGYWAGNRFMIGREASSEYNESLAPEVEDNLMMGTTLMFKSRNASESVSFPEVPWAMDVALDHAATKNEWFWEYGIGLDPFADAEHIRDHLLRAIYGAFYNAKQLPENDLKELDWIGYVMGKRESRRLVGEHILTQNDVISAYDFVDGVVIERRDIDLHLPVENGYDFMSRAIFTHVPLYTVPFRSLIAKDVDNLMMAGRCLSATHVGLGSPRVMNTTGQMGVATGFAAALCKKYNTSPIGIYLDHITELRQLVGIEEIPLPEGTIYLDNLDSNVELNGTWQNSSYTQGYYSDNYIHDQNSDKGNKSLTFNINPPQPGDYKLYIRHTSGTNRASNVPVTFKHNLQEENITVNQRINNGTWLELGTYYCTPDNETSLTISTEDTDGYVIGDAIALSLDVSTNITNVKSSKSYISNVLSTYEGAVIKCYLSKIENIKLEVFDINGRKIETLANGQFSKGMHGFPFLNNFNNSVFIVKLTTNNNIETKKFLGK